MTRLLIVENNKHYRETLKNAFESRPGQFKCDAYETPSKAPEPHAVTGIDLAVIDLRAIHDHDEDDNSGLEYARALEENGIRALLMSAYPPRRDEIFDLLRFGAITGIVDKEELSVHVIILCVENFLRCGRFPNGIAELCRCDNQPLPNGNGHNGTDPEEEDSTLWEEIRRPLASGVGDSDEELEVLLRSLVSPCATRVQLKVNDVQGQGGTVVLRMKVTCVDAPVVESLAVKLGPTRKVVSEKLRYDRFVGPLPDGAAAQLRWYCETTDLAAMAYSWVGDAVEEGIELRNLVSVADAGVGSWRRARRAVDKLLNIALHSWHEVYRENAGHAHRCSGQTLVEHYLGEGGLWYEGGKTLDDILSLISNDDILKKGEETWEFIPLGLQIDSPFPWLKDLGSVRIDRPSPVHGDLHIGNVFVIGDDSPRLIDFGRTDMGHIFRDFAALEASIRVALVSQAIAEQFRAEGRSVATKNAERDEAFRLAFESENMLRLASSLGDHIPLSLNGNKTETIFRECLHLTQLIRRAAIDACTSEPPENAYAQYLFSLALHMLRYATGVSDELSSDIAKETREFRVCIASLAAAMAAQQGQDLLGQ